MGIGDKLWSTLVTVIKMNDKVDSLSGQVKQQQVKLENLTARVIRLEAALEIALASRSRRLIEKKP